MSRRTIVILIALVASACAAPPHRAALPRATAAITLPDRVLVRSAGKIRTVALEDYVVDTILSEVSPLYESSDVVARIFEVQATIARSYAAASIGRHRDAGFDVCDTTHCQIYQPARRQTSRFATAAVEAASRTRGTVLIYDGRSIEAIFHADCGGATAAADAVWGGAAVPYLMATVDDLPDPTHRPWRVTATTAELRTALNADERTSVGRRLDSITIASRDTSGRAAGLSVRGERSFSVRGDLLRAVLNKTLGDRALMSTLFTIQTRGNEYTFSGTGYGHGVGLCQRGAATRLRRGETVSAVLADYYSGARLIQAR